jgi:DNA-binding response OmpR family regulator
MRPTILVLEDDRLTRQALREGLSRSGYEVLEASTLGAGRVLLADHAVDLVLTDLGLPDGEGTDFADHVHMRSPETPVILMTGRMDPPDREHLLRKPVRLPELLEKVAELVTPSTTRAPRRVLVVDDDEIARQLLATRLEREGYEVVWAEDAGQAVHLALQTRPDAIVSDVVMPGLDGFELCAAMRAREELDAVPIVLLTALDVRAPDRSLARAVGASALVRRSPGLDELLLTLASVPSLDTPRPLPIDSHQEHLRTQLHSELKRRQAQEHAGALLAGRLAAVASVAEVISRGGRLPVLTDTLMRLLDAPHLEWAAVYTPGGGGMLELEGHASIRFLDEQEMASFFGRGDLISFYEDDVIVTVDTPEVCERSKVSGVYLVPLVHRYRPLGVAAFGFKPTPPSPPIAFLRAAQVVLTLELIVLKSEEITDVKLVFEDSIDEPSVIGLSTLGEAPPTEEYEE